MNLTSLLLAALVPLTAQAQSTFPLKISANRRHFVTQQGKPFLYLPQLQSVTVDFGFLNGNPFIVSFFDPRTGQTIKTETVKEKKVRRIPSPPAEDLVLRIQGE